MSCWQYSLWILRACSRHTMSYVRDRTFWRMRLLTWNQDLVSNGRRLTTPGPSNSPPTSPTKSLGKVGVSGPRHTSIADVTQHSTSRQPHVLQKINGNCLITEKVREEQPVRSAVLSQHLTSVSEPWHKWQPP